MENGMENINQDSIFVKDEEPKIVKPIKIAKEVEAILNERLEIPSGYIEIKLDSLGKLSAPEVLHFRNYSMEEAVELASTRDENYLESLIKCLNRMVFEKFDCSLLHENELEEIMMNLYLIFWGKLMDGYYFYLDDTIENTQLKNRKENIGITSIDITKLKTTTLNKDFKEPIKITIGEKTVKFNLPRLRNVLLAKTYTYKKYFKDERELSDIQVAVENKKEVSYEDNKKYEEYVENKARDFLKAYESSIIDEFQGKKLNTLEEKIEIFSKVDLKFWKKYESVVSKDLKFGLSPVVTFYSDQLLKEVTRRFAFQSMDFIPPVELPDDSGALVHFGD
jgi:hypothetical protein